jgi:dihydrofolate reductase
VIISAIVARSANNVIGKDNDLPWRLPGDLRWFKERTLNRHIIMGRQSFECLPKALPKRVNIVVTRDLSYYRSDCIIRHSLDEALAFAHAAGEREVFIIGGGTVYEQTKNLWHRLYITDVDVNLDGDTFFPDILLDEYNLIKEEPHKADEKNLYSYTFRVYERIKSDTPTF